MYGITLRTQGFLALWHFMCVVLATKHGTNSHFLDPPAEYRPRFRYWLPDASVPAKVVEEDIASLAAAGAGGLEFLPFYLYGLPGAGGVDNPTPTNWSEFGFGTAAFNSLFKRSLQAAKSSHTLMDFALGPNQGAGVPAVPGTPGLAVQLLLGNVSVQAGQNFAGPVPPPGELNSQMRAGLGFMHPLEEFGTPNLTSVMAFKVISRNMTQIPSPLQGPAMVVPTVHLDESSYVDLTPLVKDGSLHWTAPPGDSTWRIISVWEGYTNQRSCAGGTFATTVIGNGSWTVDHFSSTGAQVVTDFWDQHILDDPEIAQLVREVGNYAWEDSMEILAALYWTPDLLQTFEERRGYSLVKYLPLLFDATNSWNGFLMFYPEQYAYGDYTSNNVSVHNVNFRQTLNEGYQDYIQHFKDWSHKRGVRYSLQAAYNLPLQMLSDVPLVDAPESESLGWSDNVDGYRQFSGPAHLTDVTVLSNEMGAVNVAAYSQTLPNLLFHLKRAWAGGVNMDVLHGSPYTGNYPNTTWPGYTTFGWTYTEMWNSIQPCWTHMKDTLDYIARNQYILQQGVPKLDLAFYLFETPYEPVQLYPSTNLEELGYTYDYLGPDNLLAPQAAVRGKALAADGPAYQALVFATPVFESVTFNLISDKVATRVSQFVEAGLPVIFVGDMPTQIPNNRVDQMVADGPLRDLLHSKSVYFASSVDELPSILKKARVTPRVSPVCGRGTLRTVLRPDHDSKTDYVFVYNDDSDKKACSIEVIVDTHSTPYAYDAWTGEQEQIVHYSRTSTGISLPLELQGNQTHLIALKHGQHSKEPIIKSIDGGNVASVKTGSDGIVRANLLGPATITSTSGKTWSLDSSPPHALDLQTWNLSLEDWHAPSDRFNVKTAITFHNFTDIALGSWVKLGLDSVGGIGRYSTTFQVPNIDNIGGILSTGPIVHSLRVYIDGKKLAPVDIFDPRIDISSSIKPGETHSIMIEVTSPLFNRIKAEANQTMIWGNVAGESQAQYHTLPPQDYGLLGPVSIKWTSVRELR